MLGLHCISSHREAQHEWTHLEKALNKLRLRCCPFLLVIPSYATFPANEFIVLEDPLYLRPDEFTEEYERWTSADVSYPVCDRLRRPNGARWELVLERVGQGGEGLGLETISTDICSRVRDEFIQNVYSFRLRERSCRALGGICVDVGSRGSGARGHGVRRVERFVSDCWWWKEGKVEARKR
jgi:hypothetical protein